MLQHTKKVKKKIMPLKGGKSKLRNIMLQTISIKHEPKKFAIYLMRGLTKKGTKKF